MEGNQFHKNRPQFKICIGFSDCSEWLIHRFQCEENAFRVRLWPRHKLQFFVYFGCRCDVVLYVLLTHAAYTSIVSCWNDWWLSSGLSCPCLCDYKRMITTVCILTLFGIQVFGKVLAFLDSTALIPICVAAWNWPIVLELYFAVFVSFYLDDHVI